VQSREVTLRCVRTPSLHSDVRRDESIEHSRQQAAWQDRRPDRTSSPTLESDAIAARRHRGADPVALELSRDHATSETSTDTDDYSATEDGHKSEEA
jgi:hypothetical protein